MKATLRIPTNEPYAYVELELLDSEEAQVKEHYDRYTELFKPKSGLDSKLFDAFIDRQISGGTNHIEDYNAMSPDQQAIVQVIKRSMKRVNYKLIKSNE